MSGLIDQAIEEIRVQYPYQEIIGGTVKTIRSLAVPFQTLSPSRGRLLDVGCGAFDETVVFPKIGFSCFVWDDFQDLWYRSSENLDPAPDFARCAEIEVHKQTDDYDLPWETGSFDVVTLN